MARMIATIGFLLLCPCLAVAAETHGINWVDFHDPETPPLLAMFVNFAVLAAIVFFILRRPIARRVRERREALLAALNEAERLTTEARAAMDEARSRMESLDIEMARIRGEILGAGRAESERILKEAERKAEQMRKTTSAAIEQELARVSQALREEIVAKVAAQVEDRLRESVGAADDERLARDYVAAVEDAAKAPIPRA